MTILLKTLITNLLRMLIGKNMIIWGLKLAASVSTNKVDDNVVLLVEGALKNNTAKVKLAIEQLASLANKPDNQPDKK